MSVAIVTQLVTDDCWSAPGMCEVTDSVEYGTGCQGAWLGCPLESCRSLPEIFAIVMKVESFISNAE